MPEGKEDTASASSLDRGGLRRKKRRSWREKGGKRSRHFSLAQGGGGGETRRSLILHSLGREKKVEMAHFSIHEKKTWVG